MEYIDDLTGKGHTTRVTSKEERVSIWLSSTIRNSAVGPLNREAGDIKTVERFLEAVESPRRHVDEAPQTGTGGNSCRWARRSGGTADRPTSALAPRGRCRGNSGIPLGPYGERSPFEKAVRWTRESKTPETGSSFTPLR